MITGKNELKTSTKYISCECKCKFDCRRHNSNQKWDSDKYWCEFEKHKIGEKNYTWFIYIYYEAILFHSKAHT